MTAKYVHDQGPHDAALGKHVGASARRVLLDLELLGGEGVCKGSAHPSRQQQIGDACDERADREASERSHGGGTEAVGEAGSGTTCHL